MAPVATSACVGACRGGGPTAVITDLGILEPDPVTRELVLTGVHPGVTTAAACAATGWELRVAPLGRNDGTADGRGAEGAARARERDAGRPAMSEAAVGLADRETDFVQSLQRGLAVIRAFDADNPTLTLSDVARSTGLPRAAARRFLLTLVDLGYIRVDGRQFRLSPQVLELGRAYLSSLRLPEIALPHLRDATSELRESSSLAVLDGTDIVYVAHAPAKRILSISITIGTRDVAFATSLGRVLLAGQNDDWLDDYLATVELPPITPRTINTPEKLRAELHRIRRQGWALVDQELEDGLRAIAAPIHDEHGNVIAAANLAVHASRWSNDAIRNTLLPRLLQATTAIDEAATTISAPRGVAAGATPTAARRGCGRVGRS